MPLYKFAKVPSQGERITYENRVLSVPNNETVNAMYATANRNGDYISDAAAAQLVRELENAIRRRVTFDLARQINGATEVSTAALADEIIRGMSS